MNDSIGDRFKRNYESRSQHYLTRRTPVIVRVDGRAFHTYTRGCEKPFDYRIMNAMVLAAEQVAREMQGFKMGYVQSDEASFVLTDYDDLQTEAWFDYRQNKMESIAAATMSVAFHKAMRLANRKDLAVFDARAFNLPESEVANYFVWRAKDWQRNSVNMLAQSVFSHKELQGKNIDQCVGMLMERGHRWDRLGHMERFGTFLVKDEEICFLQPAYKEIAALWDSVRPKDLTTTSPPDTRNGDASSGPSDSGSSNTRSGSRCGPTLAGSAPRKRVTKRSKT